MYLFFPMWREALRKCHKCHKCHRGEIGGSKWKNAVFRGLQFGTINDNQGAAHERPIHTPTGPQFLRAKSSKWRDIGLRIQCHECVSV